MLDIGGQDTKAIQVDPAGIVESFQMNDRCAAGCGRYLGYIADEMNMGLHELGPMAMKSTKTIRINSTCTVFAGAELRDRLSLGDKREDIMAGLHRAIILRAMSILARSGGIRDQFTFTGGVAKNEAAVKALKELVRENYGELHAQHRPRFDLHRRARRRDVRLARGGRKKARQPDARSEVNAMTLTIGIDIGSGAVKSALFRVEDGKAPQWLAKRCERIRRRDPHDAGRSEGRDGVLARGRAGGATTSTTSPPPARARTCTFATGHFYSMTTHARGGVFLQPGHQRGGRHRRAATAARSMSTSAARCWPTR